MGNPQHPTRGGTDGTIHRDGCACRKLLEDAWSVELTGLDAAIYDVYVYAPSNPGVGTGPYSINGIAMPDLPGTQLVSWNLGADYDVLSGLTISGGSLTFASSAPPGSFVGLAGIQLIEVGLVPEPSALLLVTCATIAVAMGRRRLIFSSPRA